MSTHAEEVFEDFPHLFLMLEEDNRERLKNFLLYEDGWDGGRGKRLDMLSLRALNDFIEVHRELFPPKSHLSFFFTTAGNIEVAWGDEKGKGPVEMEFYGDGSIEYLIGSHEDVANQYTGDLFDLLELLRVHQLL